MRRAISYLAETSTNTSSVITVMMLFEVEPEIEAPRTSFAVNFGSVTQVLFPSQEIPMRGRNAGKRWPSPFSCNS